MFSAVLLAALAGSAAAAPIASRGQPAGWATGYLEDYDVYHTRYVALGCHDKHDTTFFDDCCHPLLATETLSDNRKAYCSPSADASSAAVTASATAADADVQSEFQNATASVESVYESVVATATAEVTSITLSTSSIATESATVSAIGDEAWAHRKASSKTSAPTTTSTSTSEWVAPTTTSTTSTSTWSAPAQTTTAAASVGGDVKTGGHATYFYQGGNAGACGTVHSDSDYVIAIDSNGYWSNYATDNNSQYCGKWINIKNTNNGNTVKAMVADVCPTCDSNNSLDLSVGAFSALVNGDMGQGMIPIEWSFA